MSPLTRIGASLVLVIATLLPDSWVSPAVTVGSRVYARPGESVTLLCLVPYHEHRPMTSPVGFWKRGQDREMTGAAVVVQYLSNVRTSSTTDLSQRSRVSERRQFGNFSLLVANVRPGDSGFFRCEFTFRHYRATATVELRVIQVTATVRNPVPEGSDVQLRCEGPEHGVTWKGPQDSRQGLATGPTLTLRKVAVSDGGRWECVCSFASGTVQSPYTLDIVGFTDPLRRSVFLLTQSVALLPCHLNQLPPDTLPLRVAWHHQGHELTSLNASGYPWSWRNAGHAWLSAQEPRPPTNLSVGLRAVSLDQGGEYRCQASSSGITAFRSVVVTVMEVSGSDPGPVVRGGNTTLRCQVSQNSSEVRLLWRHSNQSQSPQVETAHGSGSLYLHLIEVTQREAGQWICEIYQRDQLIGTGIYSLNITEPCLGHLGALPLIQIVGISTGFLVFLLILSVTVACLIKRSRRRRRALKRLRHPLCREHSYQLSNQPLCHWTDYSPAERPLPPPPVRYCPHRQPRKGIPSQNRGGRSSGRNANGVR